MRAIQRLPVALQTVYAELADRAWTGSFRDIMGAGGTPHKRVVKGRHYWYWHPATRNGHRPPAKYLGPDTPEIRRRIEARVERAEARKDRIGRVRALRAGRMPAPDGLSGNVLAALAEAGAFRCRIVRLEARGATLAGSVSEPRWRHHRGGDHRRRPRRTVSVYYDSGVLVKFHGREGRSDDVARFVADRAEAIILNGLHALAVGNAPRRKRFCEEIDDEQLSASMSMVTGDLASGRLIRSGLDWQSAYAEALVRGASGLSLDRRQRAAADLAGLAVVEITG